MSKLEIALFFHLLGALLFVAVGAVDVLGFGLWLVDIKGVGYDAGWIQAALGLYALALILGAAGQHASAAAVLAILALMVFKPRA